MGSFDLSIHLGSTVRMLDASFIISQLTGTAFRTGAANETVLPLACPQPGVDSSAYTEDCLSMVLYVPPGLSASSNVPVLVWYVYLLAPRVICADSSCSRIHGGSFVVGSATGPGLDGSKLAIATRSIVAVIQYRLGAVCHVVMVLLISRLYSFTAWIHGARWHNQSCSEGRCQCDEFFE